MHINWSVPGNFSCIPEYIAVDDLGHVKVMLKYCEVTGEGCDWWTFCILVYEMVTGIPPFYSEDLQQLCNIAFYMNQ